MHYIWWRMNHSAVQCITTSKKYSTGMWTIIDIENHPKNMDFDTVEYLIWNITGFHNDVISQHQLYQDAICLVQETFWLLQQ